MGRFVEKTHAVPAHQRHTGAGDDINEMMPSLDWCGHQDDGIQ